ncbi:MAG: hypothetical protein JKY65_13605 [Planctomycetes bacterium]|nr:hypothetical protein [Planctomycetota bacterium]
MGWLYLAAALPLLATAIRLFGRSAREREPSVRVRWFIGGVLLAALGFDALRVLYQLTSAHPSPLAFLPTALIGGTLVYVLIREWQRLARERPGTRATVKADAQGAALEALALEASEAEPNVG